jgi:hypothetical protein
MASTSTRQMMVLNSMREFKTTSSTTTRRSITQPSEALMKDIVIP